MKIEAAVVFPADADAVFAMLTDEQYVMRKATAMGALEHDVSVTPLAGGGARIRLERTLPAMVPDFVRPLVGDTIRVVQTEDWGPARPDGARTGRMTATISAAPVNLSGELTLEPSDGSSIHRIEADVRAKVPFVGAKIEKAIGEVILLAARKEEQVGAAWLNERSG
ncbi:MAG: DUF2505 domain-containing protein [Jiangellales bacterium]